MTLKGTFARGSSDFNYGEFAIIKSQAGLNNYKISVKEWAEKTIAIGLKATAGRYGGTYAHSLSFRPEGEISCPECIATTYTY
jgi:hypothetical protein